tara:strand:+ start:375 stop:1034 length:660 start_codon:yes stop_codon:yes gene_type:complete
MLKYMNVVIPIGEECCCCSSIDKKFSLNGNDIRKIGFPFDYVAGVTIDRIYNNLYNLLINNESTLTQADFEVIFEEQFPKYCFRYTKYNFRYWHDICSEDGIFSQNDIDGFIRKYNRRYARLTNMIKTSNSITFLCVSHFNNIWAKKYQKESILKIYNLLYGINKNIRLLAINFHDENETYNTLEFVKLDVNRDKIKNVSKGLFVKTLNKFISEYFIPK